MKKNTYNIVVSGLLIAISIVLTRIFSANLLIADVPASRLSIGFLPIIISGMISGPIWGFAVGGLADLLGFLVFPSGTYFPLITLTSALAGLLPALIMLFLGKLRDWLKALICVSSVQIICSMLLQTYWLTLLYGKAFGILFFPRAIVALVTIPIYYLLVFSVMAGLKRAKLLPINKRQINEL
jgi:riboflavin transporter